jgi:circadian clock protein KaiB
MTSTQAPDSPRPSPLKMSTKKKSPPSARKPTASRPTRTTRAKRESKLEGLLRDAGETERYKLRLYVTGTSPRSTQAIANIRTLCEEHLAGRYELEVIDIYQQPGLAASEQIIAAPTLIKRSPAPTRRIIGDLSNPAKILVGLNIAERSTETKWVKL